MTREVTTYWTVYNFSKKVHVLLAPEIRTLIMEMFCNSKCKD